MKVACVSRSSIFEVSGGDTTQLLKTADELRKLGVEVDIFRASDSIPYQDFDLLHFFNIIRPADHWYHIKKSIKPYVVSTIYLDYSAFDHFGRGGLSGRVLRMIGKSKSEYLKNMLRYMKGQDKLVSSSYLLGHERAMKKVLSGAALILPNSKSEFERITHDLQMDLDFHIVPNGIDTEIFGKIPDGILRERKVVSVAQVYGMKNQHQLIRVCNEMDLPLEIIGKAPPNHRKYYEYCRQIAGKQVRFVDHMPQEELVRHYASARVHALPSWFETTGLSSLEAGVMGCNLVVGEGGDTRDYFEGIAFFCNADDPGSIKNAIAAAMQSEADPMVREKILKNYSWRKAAEETMKAYKKVIDHA